MWLLRAFFKGLFEALLEYKIQKDYEAALIENARFDAELKLKERQLEAARKAKEVADAVRARPGAAIRDELLGWVRPE